MRLTRVVFPDPVLPMMAVVSPEWATKLMSLSTGSSAPGYAKPTPRSSSSPRPMVSLTGCAGGRTLDSVSSTSPMRSAETVARGIITAMNVAIMTAIRICIR